MKTTLADFIAAARARSGHPTPETIAAVLQDSIIAGVLEGGEPLRQAELAAAFGVSTIPVREALRRLDAHGFVTMLRNRGALVSQISCEEIRETFEIRLALEPMVLGLAIPLSSAADFAEARRALREFDAERDAHRWGTLNWHFHRALYAPAKRPRIMAILERLHEQVDRFLRLQMSLGSDGKARSKREHQQIVLSCERGDIARAQALLAGHIRGVQSMILDFSGRGSTEIGSAAEAKPSNGGATPAAPRTRDRMGGLG